MSGLVLANPQVSPSKRNGERTNPMCPPPAPSSHYSLRLTHDGEGSFAEDGIGCGGQRAQATATVFPLHDLNAVVLEGFQSKDYHRCLEVLDKRLRNVQQAIKKDPYLTEVCNAGFQRSPEEAAAGLTTLPTITAVAIDFGSHSLEPVVHTPPNAFEIFPYVFVLDTASVDKTEPWADSCPYRLEDSSRLPRTLSCHTLASDFSSQDSQAVTGFQGFVESSIHLYNMAMAHVGLSRSHNSRPSSAAFHSQQQTGHLKISLFLFRELLRVLDGLANDDEEDTRSGYLYGDSEDELGTSVPSLFLLYQGAIVNKIRLASLNNMAYIFSMWGLQNKAEACLDLIQTCIDDRAEVVEHSRRLHVLFHVQAPRQFLDSSSPDGSFRRLLIRLLWSEYMSEIEEDGNDDDTQQIFELNLYFLLPSGCCPIAGAAVA
jgi:hypothetical protein